MSLPELGSQYMFRIQKQYRITLFIFFFLFKCKGQHFAKLQIKFRKVHQMTPKLSRMIQFENCLDPRDARGPQFHFLALRLLLQIFWLSVFPVDYHVKISKCQNLTKSHRPRTIVTCIQFYVSIHGYQSPHQVLVKSDEICGA